MSGLSGTFVASGLSRTFGYDYRCKAVVWCAAAEAETGPTSRCAMYDMNNTKITAPMAAPMVRVTVVPFWWCNYEIG